MKWELTGGGEEGGDLQLPENDWLVYLMLFAFSGEVEADSHRRSAWFESRFENV
jgi:hypothetical protein